MSESEFLFGRHPIYDVVTDRALQIVVLDIVSMVISCPALKLEVELFKKIINLYSMYLAVNVAVVNSDFCGFIKAIVDGVIDDEPPNEDFINKSDYKARNYSANWAYDLLSLSSDLEYLADTFAQGPHFYKEIFSYCIDELDYNIVLRNANNELISISDIKDLI